MGRLYMKEIMLIGTDPEFHLLDKGGNLKTASAISFFNSTKEWSKIGCDGCGTPVEIRTTPVPINHVGYMLKDISLTLLRISRFCDKKKLTLEAGAYNYNSAIGAHLHFGHTDLIHDVRITKYNEKAKKLAYALDTLFTPISNLLIESRGIYKRMRKTPYGHLGHFRKQNYGIEYRTPYSFLISPLITDGLFSLACLVASHYKKIKTNKRLYNDIANCYNKELPEDALKNIYKKIKPTILKLMSWYSPNPKHNPQILSLFSLIEQNKKAKTLNVLKNYNFKDIPTELTIYYDDNFILFSDLKRRLDRIVHNKNGGEIEIYDIPDGNREEYGYRRKSKNRIIELTEDLPPIKNLPDGYIINTTKLKKSVSRIGMTYRTMSDMMGSSSKLKNFTNYLNELKLDV